MNNQAFNNYNEMLKEIYFWCNCTGDVFAKGNSLPDSVENMPPKYQNLYLNYWRESLGCSMFVAEWENKPYMILEILADYEYANDLELEMNEEISKNRFWLAVQDAAQLLVSGYKQLEGLVIAVGKETDEDGHNIAVFVPYDRRDEIESIAKFVSEETYRLIRELI